MASTTCTQAAPVPATRRPVLGRVLKVLAQMRALRRQRAQLRRLDRQLLDDIGLDREQALREAQRPFWDAPSYWR